MPQSPEERVVDVNQLGCATIELPEHAFDVGHLFRAVVNNLLSLAIRHNDEVGVWLDSSEKCVYFSPGATAAFAAALTRLSLEQCDQPNLENLSLLYRYD
jgi:hypothetical protein